MPDEVQLEGWEWRLGGHGMIYAKVDTVSDEPARKTNFSGRIRVRQV